MSNRKYYLNLLNFNIGRNFKFIVRNCSGLGGSHCCKQPFLPQLLYSFHFVVTGILYAV